MNRENLQRMADYIKTIPQEKFDMKMYRGKYNDNNHQCNSIGCVIGHCTILDDENELPRNKLSETVLFAEWSRGFTGLLPLSPEWNWCFSFDWGKTDNTPIGASKRIEWLLKYGLPNDWKKQLIGEVPLVYNTKPPIGSKPYFNIVQIQIVNDKPINL